MEKKNEGRKKLWAKRKEEGLCVYCGISKSVDDKAGCEPCLSKKVSQQDSYGKNHRERTALYRKRVKKQAIDKYGGKCACCGITELMFLTVDHINNDGAQERKEQSGGRNNISSTAYYLKLIREEKREDLQILCFNCNLGRAANGGICPHHQPSVGEFHFDVDLRTERELNRGCKIKWPADEQLVNDLKEFGYKTLSEKLGVHPDSIRGRLKRRKLPYNVYNKNNENYITDQGRISD